ncbi:FAD-dependent oxidoreductase [Mycolicibacterium wolinskyi]|uniref:FAD-dependent oxidoreductase n=2 Tax=Mycolicibacterium wolinskyi TaxID=59750 RepID=UPI003917812C
MTPDVVVVGAGPTGLAAACALQEAGVAVRVFDKADGPAVTSRALGLQPRGVEVLDRLSALGHLPEHGLPVERVTVHVDGRPLASLPIGRPARLHGPAALLMSQADIEGALRDRLTALGGTVEWGMPVTGLAPEADGVAVRAGDSDVRCGWVVGADGAHSVVRKAAGIGFPGVPIIERFLLADVHAAIDQPRDGATAWARGRKLLAAFPLPGDDLWRLMTPASPDMPDNPAPDDIAGYLGSRLAEEADAAIDSVVWTSSFRIQRRLADTYRRGRVLLAGDAAHIHSPFGGQGMNTGIGDAENLAFKLALVVTGRADARLLDTYEAERRPIAGDVLKTTSSLTEIVAGQGRAARLIRDHVAIPLLNRTWMRRLIAEKASQLQVSYRRGPWGAARWLPGIRPGDRVPDRDCVSADGPAVRLYDALGPSWAVLGAPAYADVARDRLGAVAALHDNGSDSSHAHLIRPDGHLAWRGSDPAALRAWLDTALGRP